MTMHQPTDTQQDVVARLLTVFPRLLHTLKRDRARLLTEDASRENGESLRDQRGQYRLLGVLLEHERLTMQGLANALEVSPPTASTMVRRLVEHGFVTRERDPADQRIVWITVAEEGRRALEAEHARWRSVFLHRFEQLEPHDQQLISDALPAFERLLATARHSCSRKDS